MTRDRALLEALLTHSPHGIIVSDAHGRLILHNPAAEKIWAGTAPAESIADWTRYRAFHPDGRPYRPGDWQMARALTLERVCEAEEFHIQRFDGSYGWLIGSSAPVYGPDGALEGAIAIFADVTQLKQTEQALRDSEQRARLLADVSVELAASSIDYEATLARLARSVVPALADWCVIDLAEGDSGSRRIEVVHQDPAKEALARALRERYPAAEDAPTGPEKVLRTGEPELVSAISDEFLAALARDDEHLRILRQLGLRSTILVPMRARGRVLGVLTLVTAESGRLYTPRDLALAQEIAARAAVAIDNARLFAERERLIADLTRANTELDQFAYVASHDLKAPLRGIANLSQWLEEDLGERMTDDGREQMRLLRGRVHRLEALIEGILDYSRAGRAVHRPERVAVADLVREVVELLGPGPRARVEFAPDLPVLFTERVPLQQVFINLIGNALKHGAQDDVRVEVGWRDQGRMVAFSVRDNGPGIAPEFHDRIWGIFQTLQPRDRVEGTGIGLSVVKKIVERRGGTAEVDSREGQGATFTFTWPRHEERDA